jgi:hypothetical protein
MKITELQFAALTISLATLGQVDLSDNDPEQLRTLEYLLEEASKNVATAIRVQQRAPEQARLIARLGPGPGKESTE